MDEKELTESKRRLSTPLAGFERAMDTRQLAPLLYQLSVRMMMLTLVRCPFLFFVLFVKQS